ncbi:hypothetical protein N7530_008456 [Penicillium desertorum]|uniref:NWD NACHT-NTPase N-terminal domain-containing protein n=1 Tax=Penicillium desertorum TaxID=1303715 RepID=A0A9X0BL03_9EURO|nr:hypothetical protein N7530_008456 [Penicillium desertorum]
MHIRNNLKKWALNLPQRTKRRTNGAHGDCLNVSPTAESNASDPSEMSATANSVKPSGPAGNLDKLSKPDSVNCNATAVSGLPESPQTEKTIPDPSSSHMTLTSSSDSDDPWELAYGLLQAREPKLVEAYQAHLGLAQHDNSVNTNLSNPRSVQSWRVSLLGKDVKIREQTEKLAKFLLWPDPAVKSAVSTQPYAALAWAGVSLLLPIYWDVFEKNYLQPKHREEYQGLLEPLAALYSHVIKYQARAICHLSKAQLSRAWVNIAGESDWNEMISKIESSSEACSSYLSHYELEETRNNRDSLLQEIRESRSILDEICNVLKADTSSNQKNYEDQNERKLLQALASDYEDDKNYNPLRVPGTCEWFSQGNEFRNWRDNDRSTLLWISAGPGCGKSVLSRTLIDENLLSTNVTTSRICYFFFKDEDERRMSATNALCALLHQLFIHDATGTLIQNADIRITQLLRTGASFFQCVSSPELGEVVCLLDALDECNGDSMEQLLRNVEELYSKPQLSSSTLKLKFLITSRPYDRVEKSLQNFPDTTAYLHFDGDDKSAEIGHDIDLVTDAKLQKVARNFRESDRQMISKQIKDMENRTYLWLHLTFDIIEQSPSAYSRRSDVKELLSGLPSKVSDAYEKILDRSGNELQTRTLLEIVLAASRPLSLDEANIALTIALNKDGFNSYDSLEADLWPQDDFKCVVKNICGLFINVYDSKLFFIHQTAREFLADPDQSGKWKGQLSMTQSHKGMALLCLSYLSYLGGQGSAAEVRARFPLAQYSAEYWMDHSRPTETESEILDSVLKFFLQQTQAYADWWKLFDPDIPWDQDRDYEMGPPLYYASLLGLQRTAQLLLDKDENINAQGGYLSPLQIACIQGHEGIVKLLLAKGADVNAQGKDEPRTALQLASARGHQEIAKLLLANGADAKA